MEKGSIIVFCAHSDDEAAGIGGTLLKYIAKGYEVIKIVFSAGEKSHPHYKENIIAEERIRETEKTSMRFGIKETIYFGLKDYGLSKEITPITKERARDMILKYSPKKIFLPCETDPHKDHRAVYRAITGVVKEMDYQGDLYSYEVWNLIREKKPAHYVNITPYFSEKIRMMKSFKSQSHFMYPLIPAIYIRARLNGRKIGVKYAEKVYKLR
jgi:LmbE family N-acetylglucosaminyl deacetylase